MSTTETNIERTEQETTSTGLSQTAGPPIEGGSEHTPGVEDSQSTEATGPSCPECAGNLVEDGCETVCTSCGLIVDEARTDHGKEWRAFSDRDDAPRGVKGIDRTHHDNGLGTAGFQPFDYTEMSDKRQARLSQWRDNRKDSETGKTIGDIKRAGSALEMPDPAIDNACVLFKKFHGADDHYGHNLDEMAAATLYAAARCSELGVTHSTVAEQFDTDSQTVFEELDRLSEYINITLPLSTPAMYVPQIVADLDGDTRTDTIARRIAENTEGSELLACGNDPVCVAAGVVYEAFMATTDDPPTQEEVGEAAGVSPPSIRKHWRTLRENDLGRTAVGV